MKILFLTNIPSPYRVDFFNELGKECELTVIFERTSSSGRDASWKCFEARNFTPIILKGIKRKVDTAICPSIVKYLKRQKYDQIVVTNFTSVTGMLAIAWMRLMRIPYWLESDGGFAKTGKGFKERIKKVFIKGAQGYFSTAQEHDQYYLQYGAELAKIRHYPFTSLYRQDILSSPVSMQEKQKLREELGMREQKIVVAVGQFIYRKGFDVLIEAMALLPKDVGCYIIGGTPTQEYLQQAMSLGLDNVHFVGFIAKKELEKYYLAADLFVHPSREDIWGLVINEAMAKGLPVVTTDRCIAGLELIKTPAMGRIVPVGDVQQLASSVELQLIQTNEDTSRQILKNISHYCYEEMARCHITVFSENV